MPKQTVLNSSDVYSRVVNSQSYSPADFWRRTKRKWNGEHQLLPTTDSPTISACTTSTNLSGLEFQSSSTINKFLLEKNLRETIPEIEPLQPRKIDMSINSGKQELDNSDEQLWQSKNGKSSLQFCNIFRPLQSRKIDTSVESRKQDHEGQMCQVENGKLPFQYCNIFMQENSDEQLCQPENQKSSLKFCNISRQVIAAIAVSWVSMVIGYVSGYTSPAELSLKNELKITDFQFSWISGLMPLAAMFGGLLGGPLIENLGRKRTIIVTDLLFLLGWIFNYFAQQYWYLYVSRTISGCAVGIASLTLPVYLGETIQPEVRGTLGLLPTAFGNIGILLCFSMGFFLEWENIAGVGALLTIPFLLLFWIIPETPRWYISKGRIDEARKALEWLRGKGNQDVVDKEFEELLKTQKVSDEKNDKISDLFTHPNVKSLLIVLGLMFFQQLTGINAVIFYTTQIFEDTGSTIPSIIQTIIVGAVNFAATFIATILIDRLGRKVLLYISSIAVIITLAVLGVYFYLLDVAQIDVSAYSWVPLASFVVYVLGFSFGFGPVPWLMMGEILPAKIRGPAASVSTGFNWTCTFVVTTTFPLFKDIIGAHGAFWLFCAMTIIGLVFTILVVPETKGQSLEDIERKLAGVKVRRRSSVVNMKTLPSTF